MLTWLDTEPATVQRALGTINGGNEPGRRLARWLGLVELHLDRLGLMIWYHRIDGCVRVNLRSTFRVVDLSRVGETTLTRDPHLLGPQGVGLEHVGGHAASHSAECPVATGNQEVPRAS